jgi:hypothetical protein
MFHNKNLRDRYTNELIRQAQWSFYFLLFGVPALTFLYLTGNVSAAAAGAPFSGVIAVGWKLYKDSNDRLDNTAKNSAEKALASKDKE